MPIINLTKGLSPYLILSILLVTGYAMIVRAFDQDAIARLEMIFNDQQAVQVQLSAHSIEEHFNQHVDQLTIMARLGVDLDEPEAFEQQVDFFLVEAFSQQSSNDFIIATYHDFENPPTVINLQEQHVEPATTLFAQWMPMYATTLQESGDSFITPIEASPDHQLQGILLPVFQDEVVVGLLGAVLDFSAFSQLYVVPVRSGEFGAAWIQDHRGIVIYDHETEIIGRNVADLHVGYEQVQQYDQLYLEQLSGQGEYSFTIERGGAVQRKLVSWDTAVLGNQLLTVALSAPDTEISALLTESRQRDLYGGVVLIALLVIGGGLTIRFQNRRLRELVAFRTQELTSERNLLRTLIDTLPDYIFAKDRESRMTLHNAPIVTLNDRLYSPADLLGKTDFDLFPPEIAQRFYDEEQELMRTGEPIVNRVELADMGELGQRQMLVTKVPLCDESGKIIGLVGVGRDITELQKIEEARQQSEERFRLIFHQSPIAISITAPDGTSEQVNQAYRDMLGYSDEELRRMTFSEFTHPDDIAPNMVLFEQALAGQLSNYRIDKRFIHKNGKVVSVILQAHLVRDDAGSPRYFISQFIDISTRKKTELALKESEAFKNAILESVPDLIIHFSRQGEYLGIYTGDLSNTISPPEELIGDKLENILPPDVATQYLAAINRALDTGITQQHEYQFVIPKGFTYFEGRIVPFAEDEVLAFVRNITELKQAEASLRYHAGLLDNVQDAVISADEQFNIRSWNHGAEQIYGWTEDEVLGRNAVKLFRTEYPDGRPQQQVHEADAREGYWRGEVIHRRKDGQKVRILISSTRIHDITGAVIGRVAINRDITQEKEAEILRFENEKLQIALDKERELGDLRTNFMSVVAHEFRTPLTIMLTASAMMERYWDRLSEAQRHEKLGHITGQIDHMEKMLDQLSLTIRAERSYLEINPDLIDVVALSGQVISEMTSLLQNNQELILTHDIEHSLVYLDRDLMYHALINLVSNAIKYSPQGGRIEVMLKSIDGQLVIMIRDEGIGIEAADVERLYDPFYRGSNVGTIRGTGAGLSIVREIAALHGGCIAVDSIVGQGATFSLTIPMENGDRSS